MLLALSGFEKLDFGKLLNLFLAGLIYFVEVKLELMALMVCSAPKWFLALRQACPAGVGGLPSADRVLLRAYCVPSKLFVEGASVYARVGR